MTKCHICKTELTSEDNRKCEYCGVPICNKCIQAGKLLINDEINLWMCPTCSKKSLEWDD